MCMRGVKATSNNPHLPSRPPIVPSVDEQVEHYLLKNAGEPADQDALFIVMIGMNDYKRVLPRRL